MHLYLTLSWSFLTERDTAAWRHLTRPESRDSARSRVSPRSRDNGAVLPQVAGPVFRVGLVWGPLDHGPAGREQSRDRSAKLRMLALGLSQRHNENTIFCCVFVV